MKYAKRSQQQIQRHVFVAIPFGRRREIDFDRIYHFVGEAVHQAGIALGEKLEAVRADKTIGASITDSLQGMIRRAELIIADLTGERVLSHAR